MTATLALIVGIAFFWGIGRLGEIAAKSAKKSAKKAWKKNTKKRKNKKNTDRIDTVQAYTAAGMGYVADRIRRR